MAEHIVFEVFDSIHQMLSAIDTRKENRVFSGSKLESKRSDKKFYGTDSYEQAEGLIRDGWEEPLSELEAVARSMNVKTNVTRQKARPMTHIVGYAPCVPNAIMGLPNSMIATEKTPSKVKAVTIVYSPADTGGASTSSYIKAGVAVLKLVQELELSGYRVRLQAEFKSSKTNSDREYSIARVTLKDWRQPVDLKKLTFPFANASMQRRFGFRWLETHPDLMERSWIGGYGVTLGRVWDYDRQLGFYKEHGLLQNNEYFVTKQLCENEGYDVDRIMSACGMTIKLKKEV